jgi:hypothetical protein
MPLAFKSEKAFGKERQEYLDVAQRAGLECSVTADWTLDSHMGEEFRRSEPAVADKILRAGGHLLTRLDECDGSGHQAGLVIMKLRNQTPSTLDR